MRRIARVTQGLLVSAVYTLLIWLILRNEHNRHHLGVLFDSLGLTGLTLLYLLAMFHIYGWHLGAGYFKLRTWERSNSLYRSIGIRHFQRIVRRQPLPTMTGRISLESRSRSGLQTLAGQLRFAEEVHFVGFLANVALAALFSLLRDARFLVWLTVFNVMMNLYPIFLQRYNRNRVRRILSSWKAG